MFKLHRIFAFAFASDYNRELISSRTKSLFFIEPEEDVHSLQNFHNSHLPASEDVVDRKSFMKSIVLNDECRGIYFKHCPIERFNRDNSGDGMEEALSALEAPKQWCIILDIIGGAAKNKDKDARRDIYSLLLRVGVKRSSHFSDNLAKLQIAKGIDHYILREKDPVSCRLLGQIKSRFLSVLLV